MTRKRLKRRIRKLEKHIDALTGADTPTPTPERELSEPLDIRALWRDQVGDYQHGTDDTEGWNLRGYL